MEVPDVPQGWNACCRSLTLADGVVATAAPPHAPPLPWRSRSTVMFA
ncbi:MAG: hypothetical protein ACKOXO_05820 [Cyanobium sp.]